MSAIVMTDRIRLLRAVVFAALCVALAAAAHVAMAGAGVSPPVLIGAFGAVLGLTWLLAGKRRGLGAISAWMVAAQSALHLLFEQAAALGRGGGGLGRLATTDWAALLLCNPERIPGGLSPAELARMAGLDPDVPPAANGLHTMAGMHHGTAAGVVSAPVSVSTSASVSGSASASASASVSASADGTALDAAGMAGMPGMPGTSGLSGASAAHGMPSGTAHGMAHDMAHGMSFGMIAAHALAALACALLLWRGDAALVRLFDLLGALGTVVAGVLVLPLLALFARPFGYRPPAAPRPTGGRTRPSRSVLLTHAVVRRGPPALALAC
ncbi:hypothetical protein ACFV84_05610 [Kitasatospora sp. NPDC059811]|uniref:hypothetical protein n=1 Tax=Streptomycetaceae TaxID=2062 RepID=UPI0007AF1380|nr:hypothetical protein [Streptomyces sp. MJM8645]